MIKHTNYFLLFHVILINRSRVIPDDLDHGQVVLAERAVPPMVGPMIGAIEDPEHQVRQETNQEAVVHLHACELQGVRKSVVVERWGKKRAKRPSHLGLGTIHGDGSCVRF
jgi:hypothetical protein